MRGPYPGDLRVRVIQFVEAGASRRDAAEHFEVSASSAIRWLQRFHEDGTFEPMPRGGCTSPLEKYSQQISRPLRVRLRIVSMGDSAEQEASHGDMDHGLGDIETLLVVAYETAPPCEPGEGSLDHP